MGLRQTVTVHRVLQLLALKVMKDLVGGELADVQDGFALQVCGLIFSFIVHLLAAARRFLRERAAFAPAGLPLNLLWQQRGVCNGWLKQRQLTCSA